MVSESSRYYAAARRLRRRVRILLPHTWRWTPGMKGGFRRLRGSAATRNSPTVLLLKPPAPFNCTPKRHIFNHCAHADADYRRSAITVCREGIPPPLVSILIPCYNSEKTVRRCLDSILGQQTSIRFDVTVIDGSEDRTAEIVANEYPSVTLIRRPTRTLAGAARNIGVRATRGPYCMMIDSDCIAAADMIERVMAGFNEGDYAGVGGAICNGTPGSWSSLLGYLMEFKESMPCTPLRTVRTLATANLTYRRDVFGSLGGFDDTLWLTEDILFNYKLTLAGYSILFDPEIRVTHLNRTGWWPVLSYQYGMGRMSAAARLRGEMPGRILLKYPALIFLTPFVRLARAAKWLLDYDSKHFLRFVILSPAYLLGSTIWSLGFFKEIAQNFVES